MFITLLRRRGPAVLAAGAAAAAVLALAAPAGASTGPRQTSPEQAGYTADHAQFKEVSGLVWLSNPTQFAGRVARYGPSAQLWSADRVVSVDFTARTSGERYTVSATIYDRNTHKVIAFNPNATHDDYMQGTLPGVDPPVPWGEYLRLRISYTPATGHLHMVAVNPDWGSSGDDFWTDWSYDLPGQSFTKATIGTEFGRSPWDAHYAYTPPAKPVKLAVYSDVYLTSYSGHTDDLSSWWMRHKLLDHPYGRRLIATPHDLTNSGANFQIWFAPKTAQSSS